MKAIAKTRPARGVELLEVDEPEAAGSWVKLRIKACGICGADVRVFSWADERLAKARAGTLPVILGHEICGEVIAKGPLANTEVAVGDKVVIDPSVTCQRCPRCAEGRWNICEHGAHLGVEYDGGMAEFCVAPDSYLYKIPPSISDAEAAVIEPLATALHGVERMSVLPGSSVAILGAGTIGLMLLQCVKAAGAHPVIAIGTTRSERRLRRAEELGADFTVVSDQGDVAKRVRELTGGRGVDRAFEAAGPGRAMTQALAMTRRGGQVCLIGAYNDLVPDLDPSALIRAREVDIIASRGRTSATWHRSIALVASGKVRLKPIIDRVLPLADGPIGFELLEADRGGTIKVVLVP